MIFTNENDGFIFIASLTIQSISILGLFEVETAISLIYIY